jgi:hypothetical protein
MAYPTVDAPYGFKPINRVDGMAYAGAIRQMPIASDYTDPIYNGDTVVIVEGGTVEAAGTTSTGPVLGVLVGCAYTNSMGQPVQGQFFPGSGVSNAVAYVVDDPMAAFKVACTDGTDLVTVGQEIVGTNVPGVVGTGNDATGNSGSSVNVSSADDTDTLPFRVIAGVAETATEDGFVEVIVKINQHQYNVTTGNALPE